MHVLTYLFHDHATFQSFRMANTFVLICRIFKKMLHLGRILSCFGEFNSAHRIIVIVHVEINNLIVMVNINLFCTPIGILLQYSYCYA